VGSFDPNIKQSERAALVGNELDSALASAIDNFRDVRADEIFSDDELRSEANVIRMLDEILERWGDVAPYIL
jgi:hypothetical protein